MTRFLLAAWSLFALYFVGYLLLDLHRQPDALAAGLVMVAVIWFVPVMIVGAIRAAFRR
jgi:hypothetical protein